MVLGSMDTATSITLAKRLGDHNRLVLTGIGAPQSHGQRSYGLSESDVETNGIKYTAATMVIMRMVLCLTKELTTTTNHNSH
jgi:hypothetical protein